MVGRSRDLVDNVAAQNEQRWRVRPALRVGYVVVVAGFVALGIGETVVAGWDGLVVLGFAPVAIWLGWRQVLKPQIALTQGSLVVQNPYSRREVALADIGTVSVQPGKRQPLTIRLRSGASIVPWCVQSGPLFAHRTQERAEAVAAAIRARVES
jgi:hypothetical protein